MKNIRKVLEGVYNNKELRRRVVPLFMGNPGLGKTYIVTEFAEEKGVHLELFLASAKSPFELDGIGIPNTQRTKAKHVEFENILKLKDGDILFLDEMPNGNPATLNACLTFIESRITAAGRKLPDIMVVAAGNYQGMQPMTPQIKRRFKWYDVKFDSEMWQEYMNKKYYMPHVVSSKLCKLIKEEDFTGYNFFDPASTDKDTELIINDVYSPNEHILKPILNTLLTNELKEPVILSKDKVLEVGETIPWLEMIRINKNVIISESKGGKHIQVKEEGYEIEIFDKNKNKIGEIKDIEVLKNMYYFSDEDIEKIENGELVPSLPSPPTSLPIFFQKIIK